MQKKVTILGIPFDNLTRRDFLNELYKRMQDKQKTFLVTANPEIVMYAREHRSYHDLLMQADYIAPDGIGIVQASRRLGNPIKERVPGFELMIGLLELADQDQKRVYFIGAKEEIVSLAVENVRKKWPRLKVAGYHHGYFDHDDPKIIEKVRETQPDIILVAFGFPLQENWIKAYLDQADHGIAVGVGGSFDVLSGRTKRAPRMVQKLHVEWLYRLLKQPSRYKRMSALPSFIRAVYRQLKDGSIG